MLNIEPKGKRFGPYEVLHLMGTSGQSAVFAAKHETTQHKVVLRVMTMAVTNLDAAIVECTQVLEEISNIDAPNIVKIEDYGIHNALIYIAMTIMEGGSLSDRMKSRMESALGDDAQLPSAGEVLQMLERVAIALDDIHERDMVHGQIGPGSIMFDKKGTAFVSDIGLTRLMKIIFRLEATNSFNMNPYSAPELWNGERPSPATDQYALACVIYELLTGKPPFNNTSIYHLMQAHMDDVAAPPHYIRPDLPSELALVFWQALAKPVDRRFPSVLAFHKGLQDALGDKLGEETDFFTFALL
ncbi:MAG: serine/threonine-protein kinase [Anaerolineae bacterium]|nr:serine/threonine-protein kinase [Anaerolineae bacterium]